VSSNFDSKIAALLKEICDADTRADVSKDARAITVEDATGVYSKCVDRADGLE
jgi:hypothetical protein